MQDNKFLIVGTVRNCSKTLLRTINCIDKSFFRALKYEFYLVESDSTDDTLSALKELKKSRQDFNFESQGFLKNKFPKRTDRIAYCRNKYLNVLFNNPYYNWVDYMVVLDFDGVCKNLNEKRLSSCWNNKEWDVITCNTYPTYYDIWALRHPLWSPNDCWGMKKSLKELGLDSYGAEKLAVRARMIKINPKNKFINVDSAFGGFAIYKKDSIPKNAFYSGKDSNNILICEHVIFHSFITSSGGKIYINPKLIIGNSPIEHKLSKNEWISNFQKIIIFLKDFFSQYF